MKATSAPSTVSTPGSGEGTGSKAKAKAKGKAKAGTKKRPVKTDA